MARYSASAGRQFRQRAEHGARRRIMADSSTAPFWPRDWSTSVRRACRGRPGRIGASTNPASHGRATSAGHAQRGSCFRPGAVAVFALLDDPGFTWLMPIMIAVWGRRPRPDFMVLFRRWPRALSHTTPSECCLRCAHIGRPWASRHWQEHERKNSSTPFACGSNSGAHLGATRLASGASGNFAKIELTVSNITACTIALMSCAR